MNNFLFVLLLLPSLSLAGAILPVKLEGQPTTLLANDGSINACGIRLFFIDKISKEKGLPVALAFDVSMNVTNGGGVLVKGLAERIYPQKNGEAKIKKLPLKSVWIKSEGGKATVPFQGKVATGDDKVSIMYADEKLLEKYTQLMESVVDEKPIMIGVKMENDTDTRIFSGVVKLSDNDFNSFVKCNAELSETINLMADKGTKAKK